MTDSKEDGEWRGRPARAFWVTGRGAGEIRDVTLRRPGAGEVTVKTMFSGISRGTETLVFKGRVPPSEFLRMRCPWQEGEFPWPVKYGYASVGRVVEGAEAWLERVVFCLYPHQTLYVVPETAIVALPAGVTPARAVLAANLETALNAIWDARPQPGDRISVVGGGTLGALCAYLARQLPAADVELVDVSVERRVLAETFGIRWATPDNARLERDLVFHASGNPRGLETALSLAGNEAIVIELSWFGDQEVPLRLGESFHAKRLTIRSSQVGTLSPNARHRFTPTERLKLALSLCADPLLDAFCQEETPFESLPETMLSLAQPAASALCHRVRYET